MPSLQLKGSQTPDILKGFVNKGERRTEQTQGTQRYQYPPGVPKVGHPTLLSPVLLVERFHLRDKVIVLIWYKLALRKIARMVNGRIIVSEMS